MSAMPIEPSADDYELAAEILDTDGWREGFFGAPGQPSCLLGAVRKAVYARTGSWEQVTALSSEALTRDIPVKAPASFQLADDNARNIILWNDEPGRTKEEVQDQLILAAKRRRDAGR